MRIVWAYDTPHMDMNNNSHIDAEKSQAGTNLVIVILVLVIVVAGVKLLMSSDSVIAPSEEMADATSTEMTAEVEPDEVMNEPAVEMVKESTPVVMPKPAMQGDEGAMMPADKGEVAFSVLSREAVAVRAIYVHNPFRASEGDAAWIQVYDGYRAVSAGQATLVYTVSLSAIPYDQVRVRTLNVSSGIPDDVTKEMSVIVKAGEKSLVTIEL